jgi:phage shock protein C
MTQLDMEPSEAGTAPPTVRLTRSTNDRMIAGVCGGLGRYFGVDPVWFRLAFVVLALGGGSGVLIYLIAWIVVPEATDQAVAHRTTSQLERGPMVAGILLVGVGSMLLFNNLIPWFDRVMWPVLLVVVGAGLLLGVTRHDRR